MYRVNMFREMSRGLKTGKPMSWGSRTGGARKITRNKKITKLSSNAEVRKQAKRTCDKPTGLLFLQMYKARGQQ